MYSTNQFDFRFKFKKIMRLVLVPLFLILLGDLSLAGRTCDTHTHSHCVKGTVYIRKVSSQLLLCSARTATDMDGILHTDL